MEYEILEGITSADVAYRVRGKTLDELFRTGAMALAYIMMEDPSLVRRELQRLIIMRERDLNMLYFDFLQEFVFYKDAESLVLVPETVRITDTGDGYSLNAVAAGEEIDRKRHLFVVDIKSVTMHKLAVEETDGSWSAVAVLDV